jgi:hypothetical protein
VVEGSTLINKAVDAASGSGFLSDIPYIAARHVFEGARAGDRTCIDLLAREADLKSRAVWAVNAQTPSLKKTLCILPASTTLVRGAQHVRKAIPAYSSNCGTGLPDSENSTGRCSGSISARHEPRCLNKREGRTLVKSIRMLVLYAIFLGYSLAGAQDVDIVTYQLANDELGEAEIHPVDDEYYQSLQEDAELHQRIWDLFKDLVPEQYWGWFVTFEIVTDDLDGSLASVRKTTTDGSSNEWVLSADIVDAEDAFASESPELKNTLIHELGHVLTLATDQIDWDNPGIPLDNESTDEDVSDFYFFQEDCASGFLIDEGCLIENSYMHLYFQAFWQQEVFREHLNLILEYSSEEAAERLYEANENNYVSEYAATNPVEDIAESWMFFVIYEQASGGSIKDAKVNFFYQFDELVAVRDYIRSNLGDSDSMDDVATAIQSASWGRIKVDFDR